MKPATKPILSAKLLTAVFAFTLASHAFIALADSEDSGTGCGNQTSLLQRGNSVNVTELCKKSSILETKMAEDTAISAGSFYDAYTLSLSNQVEARYQGIDVQINQASEIFEKHHFLDGSTNALLGQLLKHSREAPQYSSGIDFKKVMKANYGENSYTSKLKWLSLAECSTNRCQSAFQEMVRIVSPGYFRDDPSESAISLPAEFAAVGSDPKYDQFISSVAVKMKEKADACHSGNCEVGNLFDDVMSEARRIAGTKGEEMAWTILGLYASRGAAVAPFYYMANRDNFASMAGLGIIASSMSYLDAYATANGKHPYSLPSSISTSCEYARPYHFWMSAYLAHELTRRGATPGAALEAVHRMEVSYEQMAPVVTKAPAGVAVGAKAPRESPHFSLDAYKVETIKNMAYSDAGAVFGTGARVSPQTQSTVIDSGITSMVNEASQNINYHATGLAGSIQRIAGQASGNPRMAYVFDWNAQYAPEAYFKHLVNIPAFSEFGGGVLESVSRAVENVQ